VAQYQVGDRVVIEPGYDAWFEFNAHYYEQGVKRRIEPRFAFDGEMGTVLFVLDTGDLYIGMDIDPAGWAIPAKFVRAVPVDNS
jgi:hypothetical protein